MALTSWNDILNKPKAVADVEELALTVEQLSASVLSISEDVGELALDVSQLSASVLSIAGEVDDLSDTGSIAITNTHIGVTITKTVKYGKLRVIKCYASDRVPQGEKWFDVESNSIPQAIVEDTVWLLTDGTNSGTKTLTLGTNGSATCSADVFRGGFTLIYTV